MLSITAVHRFPQERNGLLEFEPNYLWRYLGAWALLLATLVCWSICLFVDAEAIVGWSGIPTPIAARLADSVFLFTLSASLLYLRGNYLCWDPRTGAVMTCKGFSGIRGEWITQCPYSPDGEVMFEYCQAELQALCVFSYRPNANEPWLLLHIYTNWDSAHSVADFLRSWEPRLQIEEAQDQAALPSVRKIKPLVH